MYTYSYTHIITYHKWKYRYAQTHKQTHTCTYTPVQMDTLSFQMLVSSSISHFKKPRLLGKMADSSYVQEMFKPGMEHLVILNSREFLNV